MFRSLFMCNQWMAKDRGDGRTSRFLKVSDIRKFNHGRILRNNINKRIFDDHIWLSVGIRKSKSHFSRLQRLSVCLALLFMTMIANAMWYKSEDSVTSTQAISIGPISFTVHQLYTSIVSSLIVVPPMLIITIFFRKAKSRRVSKTKSIKYFNELNQDSLCAIGYDEDLKIQINALDHQNSSVIMCDCDNKKTPCRCDAISVEMMTRDQHDGDCRSVSGSTTRTNSLAESIHIPLPLDKSSVSSGNNTIVSSKNGDRKMIVLSQKDTEIPFQTTQAYNLQNNSITELREEEDDDFDIANCRTLPWWCVIIAWILVVLSIIGAAVFTILYSFQWGREKSTAWLTNFLLSFFESVVIIQPIKVFFFISW